MATVSRQEEHLVAVSNHYTQSQMPCHAYDEPSLLFQMKDPTNLESCVKLIYQTCAFILEGRIFKDETYLRRSAENFTPARY